jgi:hypothetical protein
MLCLLRVTLLEMGPGRFRLLAELERSLIAERTRARVKAAQRRGVKFGRKTKLTSDPLAHARLGPVVNCGSGHPGPTAFTG